MNRKIKIAIGFIVILVLALGGISYIIYKQQDKIVGQVISKLNDDFKGRLEIQGSHISPFVNFPYISIDLEHVRVYENKSDTSEMLVHIKDTYVGFETLPLLKGSFTAKKIRLDSGFLKLVQHTDGSFNVMNALSSDEQETSSSSSSSINLDLQSIELINIDLLKLNEENNILVEAFIEKAQSSFKSNDELMEISLETDFLFNLILDNDTSFLHHKHVNVSTSLNLDSKTNILTIDPSEVTVEKAQFNMEGEIDIDNNMDLDLVFSGRKPNFDLFLAFAPEEISKVLNRYKNGGQIYFDAKIDGPAINGNNPAISIDFGCKEAFVSNTDAERTVDELFFEGHFTNGAERAASTSELVIKDFSAKPETGVFQGNVVIRNFDSPEFDIQLLSDFNLDFLVEFLEIRDLKNVRGKVFLEMNFHDIIDLSQPEKSIERLNESYFTKLEVSDLYIQSLLYPLAIYDVNILAEVDGHEARVDQFDLKVGNSNLAVSASISDLPAILHHSDLPIEAVLDIESSLIDLAQLTETDTLPGIDEQIKDMSLRFKFNSSAKAFTESPNLPLGEFFIEKLHAEFANYPHELHDFNADIIIDTSSFQIIDFTGMLDQSDFHFDGKLDNYNLWFEESPIGDTKIDFNLRSELIQLEDLFTYGGENYVPEDYRHEELSNLQLHGIADMRFEEELVHTTVDLDKLEANMKLHSMRFKNFNGKFYYDSTLVKITNFGGELGNSDFNLDLSYFTDTLSESHAISFSSNKLDFDQLFDYSPPPANKTMTPEDHEDVFNIFEVPFSNIKFKLDIGSLNYHRYLLKKFILEGRMQSNHYIYVDTMKMHAAGGDIALEGYFNGADPDNIYFSPIVQVDHMDLDKLLLKFENFGQDHLVSENLHGNLTGFAEGKVHMHADMTPIIDDSNLHLEFTVVNGSLDNYSAFEALSSYFPDKNLSKVRFDTLTNTLNLDNGRIEIPNMSINSSIGYFEVSGEQDTEGNMEYFVRIPLKIITKASMSKLFAKRNEIDSTQVDEIANQNLYKDSKFLNLKIVGTTDDYRVAVGKDR